MIINDVGIVIPTMTEIYEEKLKDFKAIKPGLRESDSNIIISLLKFDAAQEYELYQQILSIFNDLSINTAIGNALNSITCMFGMSWRDAVRASGTVVIEGEIGTIIPQAFGLETRDGKKFVTRNVEEVVIPESQKVELNIIALETGTTYNTASNTITQMTEILSGITKIYNPLPIENGKDKESDSELRARFLKQTQKRSTFTTKGIEEYLLDNTSISACQVYENEEDITVDGLPPHSYEAVVKGGTDEEIFEALYNYKLAGIRCHGKLKKQYDTVIVGFTRAETTDLEVEITLEKTPTEEVKSQIQETIQKYIESIGFGETVLRYVVVGEIYKLNVGVNIFDIKLGEKGDVKNSDYTLDKRKVATISKDDIVIRG